MEQLLTFNLTGVAAGVYDLDAADTDGDSTALAAPVQVTEGGGPDIVTSLVGESLCGSAGRVFSTSSTPTSEMTMRPLLC